MLRSKKIKLIFFLSLWCCLTFDCNAQRVPSFERRYYLPYDQEVFPTSTQSSNSIRQMRSGIRAFILQGLPDNDFWSSVNFFLCSHQQEVITVIIQGYHIESGLESSLRRNSLISKTYIPSMKNGSWPVFETLIKKGCRLVIFTSEGGKMSYRIASEICYPEQQDSLSDVAFRYYGKSFATLSTFHLPHCIKNQNDSINRAPIAHYILTTGKIPNFLITNQPEYATKIASGIDTLKRYQAIVFYNGKILPQMRWKEFPGLESNGRIIIFPQLANGLKRLSPMKPGFRFSPDLISFNDENNKTIKIFQALPLSIDESLIAHFDFKSGLKIQFPSASEKIIFHNVELKKERGRGTVAVFNGINSYIDCGQPQGKLFNDCITISLWVKPSRLDSLRGYVSLGTTFAAKSMQKSLVFTTPEIKDHISTIRPLKVNVWQHVAFVFIPRQKIQIYYNGKLIDEFRASAMSPSDNSLMIGDNMWDEFFAGQLSDIRIWNRALNKEEIGQVYEQGLRGDQSIPGLLWAILILMIPGTWIAVRFFRRKSRKNIKSSGNLLRGEPFLKNYETDDSIAAESMKWGPEVTLFGDFHLFTRDQKDVADQFSPKRLQLFVLLLLYSFRNGKGITSLQMTEILWSGYTSLSAKNNRSTNIQKIREILADNTGISIEFINRSWVLHFDQDIQCDYKIYLDLKTNLFNLIRAKELIPESQLMLLLRILSQGPFLPLLQYEWIDKFKNEITDGVLDLLLMLVHIDYIRQDSNLILRIVDILFSFDPVNEEALKIKVKVLSELGRHRSAIDTYEHFCRVYKNLYNEDYSVELKSLL